MASKMKSLAVLTLTSLMAIIFCLICLEGITRIFFQEERRLAERREQLLRQIDGRHREPLPTGPKKDGEFRILAFGDSFTWGDGIIDFSNVWTEVLEGKLKKSLSRDGIRVVNLGVNGFTILNEYELFARLGRDMEPDLVIVQYLLNDILPSAPNFKREGEDWLDTRRPVNLAPGGKLHRTLDRHSYFYTFTNRRFLALQRKIWPPKKLDDLYTETFPGWQTVQGSLLGIKDLADHTGIEALIVIFPVFPQGEWTVYTYPHRRPHAMVSQAAERAGLDVLDLLPAFAEQGKDFSYWHVDRYDSHPNKEGHALAAEAIKEYVLRNRKFELR